MRAVQHVLRRAAVYWWRRRLFKKAGEIAPAGRHAASRASRHSSFWSAYSPEHNATELTFGTEHRVEHVSTELNLGTGSIW